MKKKKVKNHTPKNPKEQDKLLRELYPEFYQTEKELVDDLEEGHY